MQVSNTLVPSTGTAMLMQIQQNHHCSCDVDRVVAWKNKIRNRICSFCASNKKNTLIRNQECGCAIPERATTIVRSNTCSWTLWNAFPQLRSWPETVGYMRTTVMISHNTVNWCQSVLNYSPSWQESFLEFEFRPCWRQIYVQWRTFSLQYESR